MQKVYDSISEVKEKENSGNKLFFIIVAIVLLFACTNYFLYANFFMNVYVEGISMEETLHNGDYLIANVKREPKFGDIIIIKGAKGQQDDTLLIKRLIGEPGDTIEIQYGKVKVKKRGQTEFTVLEEPYAKGITYATNSVKDLSRKLTVVLEDNQYFYLGDNRENSNDSRYYGKASGQMIIGVVEEWSLEVRFIRGLYYGVRNKICKLLGLESCISVGGN